MSLAQKEIGAVAKPSSRSPGGAKPTPKAGKGKYFQSLKHKFSPIVETKPSETPQPREKKVYHFENQKGQKLAKRSPKVKNRQYQHHTYYHDKFANSAENADSFQITSESKSKKNIMKVAGMLKKRLKENTTEQPEGYDYAEHSPSLSGDEHEQPYVPRKSLGINQVADEILAMPSRSEFKEIKVRREYNIHRPHGS